MSTMQFPKEQKGEVRVLRTKRTPTKAELWRQREEKIRRRQVRRERREHNLSRGMSNNSPILLSDSESEPEYIPTLHPLPEYPSSDDDFDEMPLVPSIRDAIEIQDNARIMSKLGDPGAFIVKVTLERQYAGLALIDTGSSLNVFPKSLCDKLSFSTPMDTKQTITFGDGTRDVQTGHMYNMTIGIGELRFRIDLTILDVEEDESCPIILGRSFLATAKARFDMEKVELTLFDAKGSEIHSPLRPKYSQPSRVSRLDIRSAVGTSSTMDRRKVGAKANQVTTWKAEDGSSPR